MDWKLPVEPAVTPVIYGDRVILEMKPDVVWCRVITTHDAPDGSQELRQEAIVVLTIKAFTEALEAANRLPKGGEATPVKEGRRLAKH